MGVFFSKRKKISRVTDQDKAVLQLKVQRDNLKRFQQKIEQTLENDRNLVKRLLSEGKRDRAKLLLKKKRYQEQLLQRTDGQLEALEKLTQDLEFAQIEIKVVEGLKIGSTALKKINDVLEIQDIEQILEETKEGIEKQREIDEMISGALNDDDNEAIEAELVELISEKYVGVELPEVPAEQPVTEEKEKPKKESDAKELKPVMVAA